MADAMGHGMLFPLMPRVIAGMTGGDIAGAAVYGGWLLTTTAVMQFLFSPLLGNLSDRFGRRPLLAVSLGPLALNSLLLALAPSVGWLFAGNIIGGTVSGSFSLASAYVADITPGERRSRDFGLLNAAAGVGFILGPVLGGFLSRFGLYVPCYAAAGLSLAGILVSVFLLPESLPGTSRRALVWRQSNPVSSLGGFLRKPLLRWLILAMGLISLAGEVIESVSAYFVVERFDWTEETTGYWMGISALLFVVVQSVVCPWLSARWSNRRILYTGLALQCFAFVGMAFAAGGWMFFAMAVPYAFSTLYGPALQSMMTVRVAADRQGELQGAIASVRSFSSIVGPPMMTGLFWLFSGAGAGVRFPGAPFLVSAIIIGFVLTQFRTAAFSRDRSESV